jgi:hypothetical protein
MADYSRGAKAGAMAGVVLGIILAIGYYVVFTTISDTIKTAIAGTTLPAGLTVDAVYSAALIAIVVGTFIGSIIFGVILGAVFAAVEGKYMKRSSLPIRGLVFGVVLFLIGLVFNIPDFYYGTSYILASVLIGLIASLACGYLLGVFYQRGGPKTMNQPPAMVSTP